MFKAGLALGIIVGMVLHILLKMLIGAMFFFIPIIVVSMLVAFMLFLIFRQGK